MVNGSYKFGSVVKGLGDINNDGVDDFAVGTTDADVFPEFRNSVDPGTVKIHLNSGRVTGAGNSNRGAVFIYYGNPEMTIDTDNHLVSNLNLKGDIVIYGDDASRIGKG